jgi:hypothetical protein
MDKVIEMPMDISYEGGEAERMIFGIVLNESMLDNTDQYHNDDNIFYYLTMRDYYKVCSGIQIEQEWKVV